MKANVRTNNSKEVGSKDSILSTLRHEYWRNKRRHSYITKLRFS
jgi:hypothetical protein